MFCKIELKQLYLKNEDVQEWFKSVFHLALIPKANLEPQFTIKFFKVFSAFFPKISFPF